MKSILKNLPAILALLIIFSSCKKDTYTLGDLTPPSNIVINTELQGQDGRIKLIMMQATQLTSCIFLLARLRISTPQWA